MSTRYLNSKMYVYLILLFSVIFEITPIHAFIIKNHIKFKKHKIVVKSYEGKDIKYSTIDLSKQSYVDSNDKVCNYQDDETNCTSEGGKVNYIPFKEEDVLLYQNSLSTQELNQFNSSEVVEEEESWNENFKLMMENFSDTVESLIDVCDRIDSISSCKNKYRMNIILRYKRQNILESILKRNRTEYITVVTFLNNRIPRDELPNVQNIPLPLVINKNNNNEIKDTNIELDNTYIEDCNLSPMVYKESILDKLLLSIFRKLVQKEINYKSNKSGILGLLEEGRYYKLSEEGQINDSINQHIFVKNVLSGLLTPFLPPFYRIFMSGVIPSKENNDPLWLINLSNKIIENIPDFISIKKDLIPGKQLGPAIYAPFLTSFITPTFLSFLVGPSRINLRKDGELGGMLVEKCKFLQESNCKGLCLHQCKIPAQEFFQEKLKMPLTVSPNFITQECQWSWGEIPLLHTNDPDFPKGCIQGCETRLT